jgi:hypothetical protein
MGLCVDKVGPMVSNQTLTIAQGEEMVFSFEEAPSQPVHVSIFDLAGKEIKEQGGVRWCSNCQDPLMTDEMTMEKESDHLVTLPPGEYLFLLFGYWPQGDAAYGFAVRVTDPGAEGAPTPAPTAPGSGPEY